MKKGILKTMRSWLPKRKRPTPEKVSKQNFIVSSTATAKMYEEWLRENND